MSKTINKLSPAKISEAIAAVARAVEEGKTGNAATRTLSDGGSLSLKIRGGSALWIYKFRDGVSFRSTSLGSYHHGMSLSKARDERDAFAAKRYEERIPRRGIAVINSAPEPVEPVKSNGFKRTRFADLVDSFIELKAGEWKVNSREPENYRRLKTNKLGKMWADEITHTDVEGELKTRWGNALANADKMRVRILLVMNHAVAKGARPAGANPADKDIISQLIQKAPETVHRASMHRDDVPALMAELVADGSPVSRALAFAILTGGRNTEARLADWSEIVDDGWIIPGGREVRSMKEGEEHALPLSSAALALLGERKPSGLIFGPMYRNALLDKLQTLRPNPVNSKGDLATVHGFRSTLDSWAGTQLLPDERPKYSKGLRELVKSHKAGRTATELAYDHYDRADQLRALRPMLKAWSDYCFKV